MKWKKSDLEKYIPEKEYIDTLMISLIPILFSNDRQLADQAFKSEVLAILTNELEQELAGRILLSPPYHYLKSKDLTIDIQRLNEWIKDAQMQPFKHVFFITYDSSWKRNERDLKGDSLLWIPSVKTSDVFSDEMNNFIRGQVEQLIELIRSYW